MQKWARRIRAALGMGLIWAAVGATVASVLARLPGFNTDLPLAMLFAPLGFLTGVIFSGILMGIEGRRGFERTSFLRFAMWGAASGLLLTAVFVVGAIVRGDPWWREFLTFGPPLAVGGAICAAGSLAVARAAERRELRRRERAPGGG